MNYIIRSAQPNDLEKIEDIFRESGFIKNENDIKIIKNKSSNDIIGFYEIEHFVWETFSKIYGLYQEENLKKYEKLNSVLLKNIYIHPSYQRNKLGTKVVKSIIKEYINIPIILYSLADAEDFWEKMNFEHLVDFVYVYEEKNNYLV